MKILKKFKLGKITLNNRVCIAPMCQYSGNNGNPSKWHYNHLGNLMKTGAGLLMIESTAVEKNGMISPKDLSLRNQDNFLSFKKLMKFLRKISNTKIGLQISHSGRKGSAMVPWVKSNYPLSNQKEKWKTIAPSAIKRDKHWPVPEEISQLKIKKLIKNFIYSSQKAHKIGFDCLEIHMSHGYLLHQFFSPISNKRKDIYGGNLKNRCRLLIEIANAVRKSWPKNKVLGARVNGSDWLKNGTKISDCIYLSKELKKIGFDYVCITSGGIIPKTKLKYKSGYQVFLAKKIKKEVKIVTRTTGLIKDLNHANKIASQNQADLVSFGRKFINSPNWLLNELIKKKHNVKIPNQYKRCF